ncbi:unnamed protein product, partial [Ectocarpus sp. 4 AP-2014]
MDVDTKELLCLEAELKTPCESGTTSSVTLEAKMDMLKILQVQAVMQYQVAYDSLFYELNMEGGLENLRKTAPTWSSDLLQPKELPDSDENDQIEKQLEFYLAEADLAKPYLDDLV